MSWPGNILSCLTDRLTERIEAKGCFLLVSVARPCVSLPTTDGGKDRRGGKNMEIEQKGMSEETLKKTRRRETDRNPAKLPERGK